MGWKRIIEHGDGSMGTKASVLQQEGGSVGMGEWAHRHNLHATVPLPVFMVPSLYHHCNTSFLTQLFNSIFCVWYDNVIVFALLFSLFVSSH